jgi:hypothetical protein
MVDELEFDNFEELSVNLMIDEERVTSEAMQKLVHFWERMVGEGNVERTDAFNEKMQGNGSEQ